jgi:uncharacterized protein (TIGR02444 family)
MANAPDDDTEGAFWRFSLDFYGQASVATACLALQDDAQVDVNLLLFLIFLARRRFMVGVEELARLDRAVAAWREDVIVPLRVLRRRLKAEFGDNPAVAGLRDRVSQAEREAERTEQYRLEKIAYTMLFDVSATPQAAARANLAALAAHKGGLPQAPIEAILSVFSAGCASL